MTTTPTPDPATTALDKAIARLDNICANKSSILFLHPGVFDDLRLVLDALREARKDSVHRAQVLLAVNRSCSCGGRPAGTPSTCPACEVWHRLFGDMAARSGEEKGGAS